jgi:hypothetical protein
VALLRILFIFSFLIPGYVWSDDAPEVAEATEPISPLAKTIIAEAQKINAAGAGTTVNISAVTSAAQTLDSSASTCDMKKTAADMACIETKNVDVAKFLADNGTIINMAMMIGSSVGNQCSGIEEALNKANIALGLFQVACKAAQAICNSSCAGAAKAAQDIKAPVQAAVTNINELVTETCTGNPGTATLCESYQAKAKIIYASANVINGKLPTVQTYTVNKEEVCSKYQISTQSAMLGALNALKGAVSAKACADQNSAIAAAPDCTTKTSPSYSSQTCQCARGELPAATCQNINVNTASIKPGGITLPPTASVDTATKTPASGLDLGNGTDSSQASPTAASDLPGAPTSGGGSGMGGGGSGGGTMDNNGAVASKHLNGNILGGGFGGGGGGGGVSGAGPGYGEDARLKAYAPGGAKDPARSIASQLAKEVTPQAGKTNWEKVRLRYMDNYSSLLSPTK